MIYELKVKTVQKTQFINITQQVENLISQSGIENGMCIVYVPHTTAAVTVNENSDPAVRNDIAESLDRLIPWIEPFYKHAEGNSAAHIKSSIIGCSKSFIVQRARIVLGTWQAIYFCEFDGPRTRRVFVKAIEG